MERTSPPRALVRVTEDLWESATDHPMPGLSTHGYLWTGSSSGNVLFYSVATTGQFSEIERLGGVAAQYLSHRDEAGPMLGEIEQRFGARLYAPGREEREIARHRRPDALLSERGFDPATGVEVVPSPGHSPGSTSFVVEGAAGRYLFTGDTIYRSDDGSWVAGHLPGMSDAAALDRSLEVLGDLTPDLVVSSAFTGESSRQEFRGDEWRRAVDEARDRLAAGVS